MSNPLQDLPKQYDPATAQARWYPYWEQQGFFHSEPDPAKKPYTIVIPPPNVTGALHLGHALNNTLQDILIRHKRMQGYEALWMPGTDHAGIATQAVVERRLLAEEKMTRHDLGREGLVKRIWKWKNDYEARILGQLKSMGCSCDWQRTRFTLDPVCARAVRHTFFSLFSERLIYRGKRLVNWDTYLQTAVSDDEVFHEEVKGHFWYFRYPVIDPKPGEPAYVMIATTRPETMLGDTAVAVHPDPDAAIDAAEAELIKRLAEAPEKQKPELQSQLDDLRDRRHTVLPTLIKLRDMARAGRKVMLPLVNRPIPLVADVWAKPELGTGCVKITPAHDPNDYDVGLRQNLPMISILNLNGTLNENAGEYQGLKILKARERVVEDLEKLGLVDSIEDRLIDLAHSDRSKTPIEPLLTDQWFVRMERLAQTAIDAVNDHRVNIIPSRYAKGYRDWLSEKRDWPISRQLWWGHQIPIWSQPVDNKETLDALLLGVEQLKRQYPGIVEYHVEEDETLKRSLNAARQGAAEDRAEHNRLRIERAAYTVHICLLEDVPDAVTSVESQGYVRSEDVLDTWFSSALWPHSTLGWPEQTAELKYYYPTNVLITSRDIITLWVARMVLTGLHNVGEVPFHDVYIHPKILDKFGEGMSKSKGNGVDPVDVIEKFGADSLRFGLAYLTTETQDIRMPVDFECPHCKKLVEQTQKNRVLPRVKCPHCNHEFSTQWAEKPEDKALPRGPVVSERFEQARNFCNKLWNASRFVLMNLEGYEPGPIGENEVLLLEERWILSRLAMATQNVTTALAEYRYADAANMLYDFTWNEFCSSYIEMSKYGLQQPSSRATAQRILAHTLDTILRLLHPMIPFLTEDVWHLLGKVAPQRGLTPQPAAESVMIAPWPECDASRRDLKIEEQFARFQDVLRAVRDIRSRQNVPPKREITFSVRCEPAVATLLEQMNEYFPLMAQARPLGYGPDIQTPAVSAEVTMAGMEIYVDLADLIDVEAELARSIP
jgi:valyl-tRNA synthetase